MENLECGPFTAWPGLRAACERSGKRHVCENTISADELAFHQKRCTEADLHELINRCRDRYGYALELIRPHARLPDWLFDRDSNDLGGFYLAWSQFCAAFRRVLFNPQICLFENHRERELRRWRAVVEKECFEPVTQDADWVRTVLETAHLIPDRGPDRELYIGHLFEDIIQDMTERQAKEIDHDPCQ